MNFYSLSKAEQEAYRFYVDEFNIQKESVEGGYQEGLFKGRAEGEADKREMARKMLLKGISVEDISEITGLPPEFISCLK
jgi:predicted transposase/invertase (TIGR01784 family)